MARRGGAQHGEDTAVFLEHSLLRVRVERPVTPAGLEQYAIPSEHAGPERTFYAQVRLQFRQRQFLPVDAPVDPALQRCLAVVARAEQRMEINPRHTCQRQHDGLSHHEAVHLRFQGISVRRIV